MRIVWLVVLLIAVPQHGHAAQVTGLAKCTTAVFREMARTGKWSGKPPAGCPHVEVETQPSGLLVTAWGVERAGDRWVETSFTSVMDFEELAAKRSLSSASQDIMALGKRLEQCLTSFKRSGDPRPCRRKGSRDYLVGEESGVEDRDVFWLEGGRSSSVEYAVGDTSSTPTPPVALDDGEPLPPGMQINLYMKNTPGRSSTK